MMKKLLIVFVLGLFLVSANAADLDITAVNYDPAPAIPGAYVNLWIQLKNISSFDAEDVIFTLDMKKDHGTGTYPFSLDSGVNTTKTFSSLKAKQSVIIEYKIKVDSDALDGTYSINLKYGEDNKIAKGRDLSIRILNRNPDVVIINSEPAEVSAGELVDMTVKIRNIGYGEARDIMVGVDEDRTVTSTGVVVEREFSIAGSSSVYAGNLDAEGEKIITLKLAVSPEAEMKTYNIPISIKYKDSNFNAYSVTKYLGVMIKDDAEIDAIISSTSPAPYLGGTSELVIDLFNIGSGDAKYVVAEVSAENIIIDTPKIFIGSLEPDDFDSFKIKATVSNETEAGPVPVKLTITYKDGYSEPKVIEKTLMLTVGSFADVSQGGGIDIWFLVVVAIVLFWGGKKAYKRIKKK